MQHLIDNIKSALAAIGISTYPNTVYRVIDKNEERKAEIKAILVQGNSEEYHTIVEIDFEKIENKTGRRKKNLETTKHRYQEGGIEGSPVITIYNSPLYIYGEYVKLSRKMSQTPLKIGGKLKTVSSVSDFTGDVREYYGAEAVNFIASGREDIDVRCLEGRAFILEIASPTRNLHSGSIELAKMKGVCLSGLCVVDKECKRMITSDESTKLYRMIVFSPERLEIKKAYSLQQKTPLRVLHRRCNMVREKEIEVICSRCLPRSDKNDRSDENDKNDGTTCLRGHYYEIVVRASSGAYIKEWVTGDFGRTVPNLNADILELDVIRVEKTIDPGLIIRKLDLKDKPVNK